MIVVEWSEGRIWPEKFQAVFWIKLRDLQRYSDRNLVEILSIICVGSGNQAKEVHQLVRDRANHRCLMLLDGYDEVVNSPNKRIQSLLKELLREEYIILTSRPLFTSSIATLKTIGFSRMLDIKGFTSENIETYIQRFASDKQQATQFYVQLKRTPHVFSLAHIPIQLELLLTLWEQEKGLMLTDQSTTEIYLKLTEKLGNHYMKNHLDSFALFYSEATIAQDPIAIAKRVLQKIAYEAFQQQEIYIKEESISSVFKDEIQTNHQCLLLVKDLLINSGFLRRYQEGETPIFAFCI